MMEITKTLNVPIKQLFTAIRLSFKQDYYASTSIELSNEQIVTGLSYVKQFGANNSIKITLIEFKEPNIYGVEYHSNRGKQQVIYQLFDNGDQTTRLLYQQKSETEGLINKANEWLMMHMMKGSMSRKIEAQIHALEQYALSLTNT